MITSVRLRNFKCFSDQKVNLARLTLLAGMNGVGKSSIIQSLILLHQSYYENHAADTGLRLMGDYVRLGTGQDVLFEGNTFDEIHISLESDEAMSYAWAFRCSEAERDREVLPLGELDLTGPLPDWITGNSLYYVPAERIGPRTVYALSDEDVVQHNRMGPHGEFTVHYLFAHRDDDVPSGPRRHSAAVATNLLTQVEAWLGEISPGTTLLTAPNRDTDSIRLGVGFRMETVVPKPYRPTNVGFGISYTLPVIVALLAAKPGSLVLIENPEAHLHPRGQTKMGELIARAAAAGIQVVVESHSDHVLNAIRLAVHDQILEPSQVAMHFFKRGVESEAIRTELISPRIDSNGRIDRSPEGFFDEWGNNLRALMTPQRRP